MGSFWGMNDSGKESAGWPRELGAYSAEQMKEWLGRQNNYSNLADYYTNDAAAYWGGRREDGFGTPEQIAGTGRQISPWVQPYVSNALTRRQDIRAGEMGRRPAGEVAGEMGNRLDEMGQNIGGNYTSIEGDINDTAGRAFGRDEGASTDVVNNIRDSSGGMRALVDDTFTGLRRDNTGTYGDIKGRGKGSFAEQMNRLALIAPGSQAQGARVARSFAPQIADTLTRIRRAGIDPSSPEAASLLRGVETDRSRAMDDASAAGTESFIRQSNDVSNAELGFMTAADRARLENEAALATGQTDRANKISDKASDAFQTEKIRASGVANAIDRDRSGRTVENTDQAFTRGQQLLGDRNNLSVWGRNAGMEDTDRLRQITEGDDASELQSGRLQDTQFDRGTAFTGMNQQTRDNAVTNLGTIGNNYRNSMFQSGTTARGFGDQASKAYADNYALQAPKAGWGSRLIGAMAGPALSMIPGVGPMLAGFATAGMGQVPGMQQQQAPAGYGGGQGGGFGGGTNGGGFRTPNFNPSMYQMPSFSAQPYSYDPAKTQTLPNGDLQVGRTQQPRQWGY